MQLCQACLQSEKGKNLRSGILQSLCYVRFLSTFRGFFSRCSRDGSQKWEKGSEAIYSPIKQVVNICCLKQTFGQKFKIIYYCRLHNLMSTRSLILCLSDVSGSELNFIYVYQFYCYDTPWNVLMIPRRQKRQLDLTILTWSQCHKFVYSSIHANKQILCRSLGWKRVISD